MAESVILYFWVLFVEPDSIFFESCFYACSSEEVSRQTNKAAKVTAKRKPTVKQPVKSQRKTEISAADSPVVIPQVHSCNAVILLAYCHSPHSLVCAITKQNPLALSAALGSI